MQVQMVDKILQTMKVEVLVGDSDVKFSHGTGAPVPKKGEELNGYTRVPISDRQTLQEVGGHSRCNKTSGIELLVPDAEPAPAGPGG